MKALPPGRAAVALVPVASKTNKRLRKMNLKILMKEKRGRIRSLTKTKK
jgi:hypothetical protein